MGRFRTAVAGVLLLAAAACTGDAGPEGSLSGAPPSPEPAPSTSGPTPTVLPEGSGQGPGALVTLSGVVVPVLSGSPDGRWTVTTPCGRTAEVTGGTFVASATIVLDAGHGGGEPGAVAGGLQEKVVNLAVTRFTEAALKAAGVPALPTRTGDYTLTLPTRAKIAQAVSPRAMVSIHHNAEPDEPWPRPGSETYYQIASSDSKRLAGLIYEELMKALTRYGGVTWVADRDAGVKYRPGSQGDYYAVLRQPAPVVSVLVESAFISNPPEAELLARADVQRVEGEAIARGIVRYLTSRDPGSGFVEPYPRPTPPPSGRTGPCTDPPL